MCKYCEENKINTLIEDNKPEIAWDTYAGVEDNSVVLETRNGIGYLRLGDREDMECLGHGEKIKINFCPMCGRKLNNNTPPDTQK